jgi:lysophospholipase L1-like esterase
LVFVSLGTNDAVKQTTGAQIKRLAEKIRAAGAKRIVWLVPPATAPLPGLAAIRAAINAAEVDTATTHVALRKDGLHPSNYAIAAKDVLRTLAT